MMIFFGSLAFTSTIEYGFNNILQIHQQKRILDLLGLESDLAHWGYNVNQSKIANGSGGFWGKGFLEGTQIKYGFVPERHTDFIFCTVGEEWGFVGTMVVLALLCLLLMAAFYLAVIIGQPQEDETASTVTPRTDQPLLPAGQDVVTITSADDLPLLLRMFPAPALMPTTSGWPLVVGTCYDVAFENGMGRILTLTYQASDTIQVTLTSIYPARAIALLEKGDYRISASLGATLAGLRSIRMENAESIRLHAQGEEALYVMITPLLEENSLRSIAGQMTLTEGE